MINPNPEKPRYTLTPDDIISINEMMDVTHSFHLKVSTDRGDPSIKSIFMFAPGRNNEWCTGQGDTVCESVDNWFKKTSLRRWNISAHRIKNGGDYLPG
jgi:hypothetical protein